MRLTRALRMPPCVARKGERWFISASKECGKQNLRSLKQEKHERV